MTYYPGQKEFKDKIALDVFGSELIQCQNIGQHGLIGRFRIKPMLYLDQQHVPLNDLLALCIGTYNRQMTNYTYDELYYLSTYAYLTAAIKRYKESEYRRAIIPYIKGWHNSGESTQQTLAEFVGQLKAMQKANLDTFTIWSMSKTVSRLIVLANEHRDSMTAVMPRRAMAD